MKSIQKLILLVTICCFTVATGSAKGKVTWKDLDSLSTNMQSIVYRSNSDTTLKIYFIKPGKIRARKKYPAVIWLHGGGWNSGTASTFFSHAAYFSLRGAVGISIEYRLIKLGKNDITDCIADCKSAIRFIKAHADDLNIDTTKIIVAGDSAGGHLAACTATIDNFNNAEDNLLISAKPNALLLFNPGLDMTVFPHIKNMSASAIQKKAVETDTAVFKKQFYEKAYSVSPLFYVTKNIAPTLLMHGLEDKVILPALSIRFSDAMKLNQNRCDLILLRDTRHAFVVPYYTASEEKVVNAVCEADKFLVSLGYLKGKPTLAVSGKNLWPAKY